MTENSTSTPAAVPTPTPETKPKRTRSIFNRKHLKEIANSRAVAKAALDPAHAAVLTVVEMDATLPPKMVALADATETAIGKLSGNRTGKTDLTAQELLARDALIAVIAPIQTAAKRVFSGNHETLRNAYYIGEDLHDATLQEVQVAAVAIRDRLVIVPPASAPVDVLPGIKAPQIAALSNAITTYASGVTAPVEQQVDNFGALNEIEANIVTLAGQRRQVQLAAEQGFPWRTPGVAAIRQAFLLPGDRPLPT
jgi:hypothetical protein